MVNQKVKTEFGDGIVQGNYAETDALGMIVSVVQLVRLTINDKTIKHLKESNCLTPNANKSALFTFPISESGQGWAEWLIIAALLVLVVIFAGDVLGWAW